MRSSTKHVMERHSRCFVSFRQACKILAFFRGGGWPGAVRVRGGWQRCAVLEVRSGPWQGTRVPMKPRRKSGAQRAWAGYRSRYWCGIKGPWLRRAMERWFCGEGWRRGLGRAEIGLAICWRCRDRVSEFGGGTARLLGVAAWRSVCHVGRWSRPCFIRVSSVAGVSCVGIPGLRLHPIGLAACMVWLDAHFSSLSAPPGIGDSGQPRIFRRRLDQHGSVCPRKILVCPIPECDVGTGRCLCERRRC